MGTSYTVRQYNSALTIKRAIKNLSLGISLEKLDNELGSETLEKVNDTGKYASSAKFIKVNLQNTYLTLFT